MKIASCVCALFFLVAGDSAAQTAAPPDLQGVWQARRYFGPDVRGPLTIERHATQ